MDISPINQQPISPQGGASATKWIVIALAGIAVIAGGAYFFTRSGSEISPPSENGSVKNPPPAPPVSATNPNVDEAILGDIRQVSAGKTAKDIQADIDSTDIQMLDEELSNLDQEMKGL